MCTLYFLLLIVFSLSGSATQVEKGGGVVRKRWLTSTRFLLLTFYYCWQSHSTSKLWISVSSLNLSLSREKKNQGGAAQLSKARQTRACHVSPMKQKKKKHKQQQQQQSFACVCVFKWEWESTNNMGNTPFWGERNISSLTCTERWETEDCSQQHQQP